MPRRRMFATHLLMAKSIEDILRWAAKYGYDGQILYPCAPHPTRAAQTSPSFEIISWYIDRPGSDCESIGWLVCRTVPNARTKTSKLPSEPNQAGNIWVSLAVEIIALR
jgi:hypothetical protein